MTRRQRSPASRRSEALRPAVPVRASGKAPMAPIPAPGSGSAVAIPYPAVSPPAGAGPWLCVVLHDVAPSRWAGCTRVLGQLRRVAAEAGVELPVTLLVVPQMHGLAESSRHYLRWLHRLADAGHELALHGLTHRDEGRAPQGLAERLLRHSYTAGEGEFSGLTRAEAAERIARGQAWAHQHRLRMPGFVAPAWLLNAASWDAVADAGFSHTATLDRVFTLPDRLSLKAQSLVFSTRSGWRRGMSVVWNTALGWQQRRTDAPLMRLELHPTDSDHPAIERCWQRLLATALRERQPLLLAQAAGLARLHGTPPAYGRP